MSKTVVALTAAEELLNERFEAQKVLVIAPKRVAEDTWTREAAKWDHLKHLRVSRVLGSAKARTAALRHPADIYVINRENVVWLVETLGKDWDFDMVIIDELSSFKSPKAQRFRALRAVRPRIRRVIGLTGTPAPNGLIDLWSQIYLLDRGLRLGKTVGEYRRKYFQPGRTDKRGLIVYDWDLQEGAEMKIYQRLDDLAVSMKAEDWLEMPERVDLTVPIRLSGKEMGQYKKLERDLILEIADETITAGTAAAVIGKLQQYSQGAVYGEDGSWTEVHSAKLEALEELIEAANGKPVLIFYWFRHDEERLLARIKGARVLKDSKDIADWNAGKIPVLLAHPGSAGHGLNLQDGGSTIIWFGLTWSLELYQQANARLHRQGQRRAVIVHHLVTEGTVDEDIIKALSGKADGQNALMEAVKARVKEIKHDKR